MKKEIAGGDAAKISDFAQTLDKMLGLVSELLRQKSSSKYFCSLQVRGIPTEMDIICMPI